MKIIIVGAGLGGLAAAISAKSENPSHDVQIIEAARELAEIGAGLQVTPNATRLLKRWGIGPECEKAAANPRIFTVHRYSDGKLLGKRDDFGQDMETKYKSGFWDMHRADLQKIMYNKAVELGVSFRFASSVSEHDFQKRQVTLADGEVIQGDLIVAADGLWSKTRAAFLGKASPPLPTGDLAYRVVLHTKDITDPELKEFSSLPRVCLWAGPGAHVVYYPLRNNTMVNLVLLVPDNLPDNISRTAGDLKEMHDIFEDWDPRLRKFLSMVDKVDKWKLMYLEELERWHNDEGSVVFLGDACHPMLPYMAQGAGSALEDGATLGMILAKVETRQELPAALKTYEGLRKPRSSYLQRSSMKQREVNHLPNGEAQQARDELAISQLEDPKEDYPFYWINPSTQATVYGYDCIAELRKVGVEC